LTVVLALVLVAFGLLGGCATDAQRRAAENAAIQKEAAQEIRRICALPQPQRDAELERIKTESGIVLQCGSE
jgi:carbamate kinase